MVDGVLGESNLPFITIIYLPNACQYIPNVVKFYHPVRAFFAEGLCYKPS